jgi:membrane protein YqaA with SNARE-associated domain
MLTWSAHPKAVWLMALISFAESSFFPLPPDAMLVPMVLAQRKRAFFLAGVCTLFSVLGGMAGYLIGLWFFEGVAQPILEFYGAMAHYHRIADMYEAYGEVLILLAGVSPIPYKVFTISSGAFHFNLITFLILSALSRGARFFLEALILWRWGETAQAFLDRHFNTLCYAGAVLLISGFLILKLWL